MASTESDRILKANAVRSLGSKIAYNYEDLRHACDAYVEKVRAQAERILDEARTESEEIRRSALRKAVEEGRREGLHNAEAEISEQAARQAKQTAQDQLKTTLPAMREAAEALAREKDRWLAEWETVAVRLSVAIAEKILRRRLETDAEVSAGLLKSTLELAAGVRKLSLRLHPDDATFLGEHVDELVCSIASCGEASVIPDSSVSRGGCLIETQHAVIDARLETQLERIVSELLHRDG
jgi:flagellar assembly protein FliH